jgi:4-hydroxybenzoate polyprenyltransferase
MHHAMRNSYTIFVSLRLGRIFMMTFVTAATAWGFGATPANTILAAICGALLSIGGFFLDHLSDAESDKVGGKKTNPFSSGMLSIVQGRIIVVFGFSGAGIVALFFNPWALLPVALVAVVVIGLTFRPLNTPLGRAVSLGLLQSFYALLGGLMAHGRPAGVVATALFLFFAMTGGRAIGDVRDLPFDEKTNTMTIPRRYGMQATVIILLVNEALAYGFGLALYFTGAVGPGYLPCIIGIIVFGTILNVVFAMKPTPSIAHIVNGLSLGVLGSLYSLGMILGRG